MSKFLIVSKNTPEQCLNDMVMRNGHITILSGYDPERHLNPVMLHGHAAAFWVSSLITELLMHFSGDKRIQSIARTYFTPSDLTALCNENTPILPRIQVYQSNVEVCENFLDEIDQEVMQRNQLVIFVYRSLSSLCVNQDILNTYIRALLSYWLTADSRWERLKCKIFIPPELLNLQTLYFPDSSKLKNCRIDL